MKKFLLALFLLLPALSALAQDQAPQMADALRASGKIYVVVCVAGIVLAGLIIYLVLLDRKITRLEKEIRERQKN